MVAVKPADLGTSERVDQVIGRYPGLHAGLFANETDALLAALVLEQQADRLGGNPEATTGDNEQQDPTEVTGTYWSRTLTVGTSWEEYEWSFVSQEIDLRHFSDTFDIAFMDPAADEAVISYKAADAPVAGIQVETHKVWIRSPNGEQTLDIEVWR